jgi:hypothetical protein
VTNVTISTFKVATAILASTNVIAFTGRCRQALFTNGFAAAFSTAFSAHAIVKIAMPSVIFAQSVFAFAAFESAVITITDCQIAALRIAVAGGFLPALALALSSLSLQFCERSFRVSLQLGCQRYETLQLLRILASTLHDRLRPDLQEPLGGRHRRRSIGCSLSFLRCFWRRITQVHQFSCFVRRHGGSMLTTHNSEAMPISISSRQSSNEMRNIPSITIFSAVAGPETRQKLHHSNARYEVLAGSFSHDFGRG